MAEGLVVRRWVEEEGQYRYWAEEYAPEMQLSLEQIMRPDLILVSSCTLKLPFEESLHSFSTLNSPSSVRLFQLESLFQSNFTLPEFTFR